MTDRLPPRVIEALQQGRKVEAIQRLRKDRGLDLTEAKATVDAYLDKYPHMKPKAPSRTLYWVVFIVGSLAYFWLTR